MAQGKGKKRIVNRKEWKRQQVEKFWSLVEAYPKCFIVGIDNVGSKQMQEIRQSLRGHAEILVGKNTLLRSTIIKEARVKEIDILKDHISKNVALVFTKEDLSEVREKILANKRPAPAKAGSKAPNDVIIPAQNTGLPPEKTSFFQALAIPTKINRGTIEILSDVTLLKEGQRVGASEASLLTMLKIQPFSYGFQIFKVYEGGSVFEPKILDITNDSLLERFNEGVSNIASLALAIGHPTIASVKHSMFDGIKNLFAITLQTSYDFPAAKKLKDILSDPAKLKAAQEAASAGAAAKPAAAPAKEEKKKDEKADDKGKKKEEPAKKKDEPPPKEEEEEGDLFGGGLFD